MYKMDLYCKTLVWCQAQALRYARPTELQMRMEAGPALDVWNRQNFSSLVELEDKK